MTDVVYLECIESGASKFWSGTVEGKVLTTRWGKIGTQGQSKEETFEDAASAKASLDKQAAGKVKKGYKPAADGNAGKQSVSPITSTPASKPNQSAAQVRAVNRGTSGKSAAKAAAPATKTPGATASNAASKKSGVHATPAKPARPKAASTKAPSTKAASATSPMPTSKPQLSAWLKDASRTGSDLAAAAGKFPETERLIAAHTLALSATLSTLSHSSDKATRSKVAANPNTPPADYVRLGQQFPNEFLANPALDLLFLENPGLLGELPEALLLRVLKRETCPADFLVWAAGLPAEKIQLAVAMNPAAPADALERLRKSVHPKVRETVSAASSELQGDPELLFREAVKERLAALTVAEAYSAWGDDDIGLPQFPFLSVQARMRIANLDDYRWGLNGPRRVRRALAGNPNAAVALLEILVKDEDEGVRSLTAKNPNTPVASLELLAMDEHKDIRCSVAGNPNTPATLLEMLAKDTGQNVRCSVASNPNTLFAVLNALSNDADPWVSFWVAENPQTPVAFAHQLLSALALRKGEKNLKLRCKVALSPRTPVSFLDRLANDREYEVRGSVAKNPMSVALLDVLAKDDAQRVRSAVAENAHTSVALLDVLAKDKEEEVRSTVAQNPNTPIAVLEALAKDRKYQVRSSVAQNPNTPVAVLEGLATDKNWDARVSVAGNPSTPVAVLEALSKDKDEDVRCSVAGNPNTLAVVLGALAKDKYLWVRSSVAANPNTPVAMLEALAKDEEDDVRISVAENPNAPVTLLGRMIELDQEERVRQVSDLQSSPWIASELASASKECRAAVDQGNFLCFLGKDPNRTVLSRRPLGILMALCGGPFVEPSRIARVAGSGDWLIRAAVAQNRGLPPNLRNKLASDAHPLVRALAVAADSPAVATAPRVHRAYVFPQKRVVRELAGLLKGIVGVWYKRRLARDPGTPQPILAALGKDRYPHVRFTVAGNPHTPASTLDALANDTDNSGFLVDEDMREVFFYYGLSFCRSDNIRDKAKVGRPPASLQELLSDEWWYRRSIARDPSTRIGFLEVLAKDNSNYVRSAVAENPNTSAAVLAALAKDDDKTVRSGLANNPNTPVAVLEALALDKEKEVRGALTHNTRTGVVFLELLAKDNEEEVRRSVAENPNTPVALLEALAKDNSKYVRSAVAENPSTSVEMLAALANDEDETIRSSVAKNPNTPSELRHTLLDPLVKHKDMMVRTSLVWGSNIPVSVLESLSKDEDEHVRSLVAQNPDTPIIVLAALAKDKSNHVRQKVATNLCTPVELLGALARDKSKTVREAVADPISEGFLHSQARLSPDTLEEPTALSERSKEAMTLLGISAEASIPESSFHFWLSVLAGFPMTPDNKALTKASRDTNWLLRLGAVLHPQATDAMLELLTADC